MIMKVSGVPLKTASKIGSTPVNIAHCLFTSNLNAVGLILLLLVPLRINVLQNVAIMARPGIIIKAK